MKTVASLWIGDRLGVIERTSINSFLKQGHHFILYAYNNLKNIPDGIELRNAQDIFPCEHIIQHKKTGSVALHSDLFRYALMKQKEIIWVDLDIIALKHFNFDTDWIIGFEKDNSVGNAVLRLPEYSKALQEIQKITPTTKWLPPTLDWSQKIRYFFKSLYYGGLTIDRWPYGHTGPGLITYYMKQFNEISHVMPTEIFYSVPFDKARDMLLPETIPLKSLPKEAYAIHLWGKELKNHLQKEFNNEIPEGSLLAEIISLYS